VEKDVFPADSLREVPLDEDARTEKIRGGLDAERNTCRDFLVFCLDNSNTRKEGMSRTYYGYDGYAPIGAYLGEEGLCIGLELRPGNQHSRNDFLGFVDRVLPRARELGKRRKLLMLLDSGHDAAANRERLSPEQVNYVIKWNPRHEYPHARRAVRGVERSEDRSGQPLLLPQVERGGCWTNLDGKAFPADERIVLYRRRGASEQYQSEFRTDLNVERLPSGKFETDALVLPLAVIAYNMLRYIGQNTLTASPAHGAAGNNLQSRATDTPRAAVFGSFWAMRPGLSRAGEVLSTGDGGLNPRQTTPRTT